MLRCSMDIYIEAVVPLLEAAIVVLPQNWTALGPTKVAFCCLLTIYILIRRRQQ